MAQSQETKDQINAIAQGWDEASKLLHADEMTLDSLIAIQHEFQKMATLLAVQIGIRQAEKMSVMELMSLMASKRTDDELLDEFGDEDEDDEDSDEDQ